MTNHVCKAMTLSRGAKTERNKLSKVLFTVFFDCNVREKRTLLWKNQSRILHHSNAPAHTSMLVREFFDKNKTIIMPQPPYSSDLAPLGFFLFTKLKTPIKWMRFATIEEIKEKS